MEKQKLIDEIYQAFGNVKLEDGIGLWEGQGLDDYADEKTISELRKKDEKDNWDKISFEDLNRCSSSLCFFDAKGMRFHLPQFMLCEVIEPECCEFNLLFHLELAVSEDEYSKDRFSLLDVQQTSSIIHFIEYYLQRILNQSKEYAELYGSSLNPAFNSEYLETKELLEKWEEKLKIENNRMGLK